MKDDDPEAEPPPYDFEELTDESARKDALIYVAAKGDPLKVAKIENEMTWAELLKFISIEKALNWRPKTKKEM